MKLLENKNILITGGSRGIGKGIVYKLVENGANVAFTYSSSSSVSKEIVNDLASEKNNVKAYKSDASVFEQCETLIKNVISDFGDIDVLINNAGITNDNLLIRMDDSQWFDTIETNINSLYKISKIFVKPMIKKRNGRIICISSVVASTGNAGQTNYVTSKSGMIGFCKSLAKEVATRGITVNCVSPGFIETDMTNKLNDAQKEQISKNIPTNKMGSPEDIAYAVSFLASDKASYITGETINVNGGLFMP
jgi:3-oxoacyl-[acyl-carrier protein] reductase